MKLIDRIQPIFLLRSLIAVLLVLYGTAALADQKGLNRRIIKNISGQELSTYSESAALLIAVADYTHGWPDLESVTAEIDSVEKTLKVKGFTIVRVNNPNNEQLSNAYRDFIKQFGYVKDNRLLFYFSGHGHSLDNNRKGYLVPSDAPHPDDNLIEFKKKALDMNQLLSWARQMDAKHGLFVFDSCFSGTIFKQKNLLPKTPPPLDKWTSLPVRQFMTAGSAGETVPANSTFTPAFIDAINGKADLNSDGYVIGTELGLYLQAEVSKHVHQTPQYGKIDDYQLSRGDFVFFVPEAQNPVAPTLAAATPQKTQEHTGLSTDYKNTVLRHTKRDKTVGIEINPVRLLTLGEKDRSFSGSVSYFPTSHSAELAIPFFYSKSDSGKDSEFQLITLDIHYRYFLNKYKSDGLYIAAFSRLALLDGQVEDTSIFLKSKASETKFGVGFSVGYRYFSNSRIYWGISLSFGKYVSGEYHDYIGTDAFFNDDSDFIFDMEILKFGFAF